MGTNWILATLMAAVLISALAVVYAVHASRSLVDHSQKLQRALDSKELQWSQLLLEHSTWGGYARVERLAREELDMVDPVNEQRMLIRQ